MSEINAIGTELIAARKHLDKADALFAERCDLEIIENHEGRDHLSEQKQAFEGGATRSAKIERYDLVPVELDECVARRYGLGAIKHGDNNWKKGGAEFILSCLNHLRAHYVSLVKSGPWHDDDDIGAIGWAVGALAWFREHKPDEFRNALASINPQGERRTQIERASDLDAHPY